ncbi:flagellar hook-associated protein FlgK [Pseudothermotoga thermarum]|uniref:Flagellar hook-associated protein 1 n=1 Tax=Pseudothermotoga thermarum DSM 5069 TaxID=688269 RepID=F7YYV1_9THEM|nr:flagellar hook-associated protein FlgK [Pseudothermotoga thermarum]AEH51144.1 flagellar hook-associated protein FlgK [Pseudothermotoga thermarum DSM 5069]
MPGLTLFGSLNTALLGVYTHKLAMNVVGHNVANANTEGYSRQRPVIMNTLPLVTTTLGNAFIHIGRGSYVKNIERIRDAFLDIQYRQVSNRYSFYETIFSNLHYLEQLFAEPGNSGIRAYYDTFLAAAEEVISDPTNVAAKRQFVTAAQQMVMNIQDIYNRIQQLREDINNEIALKVSRINTLVSNLARINEQIRIATALRATPNDLMDERDRILDELSNYANISYYTTTDGQTILSIGDQIVLAGSTQIPIRVVERPYGKGFYELFVGNSKLTITDGSLKALIDLRDSTLVKYMSYLDEFALNLSDKINLIHRWGFDSTGKISGLNFFTPITATRDTDPAIFRILGSRQMVGGPIRYVTGLNGFSEDQILNTVFNASGKLVLFDGSSDFDQIDVNAGMDVGSLIGNISSWLSLSVGSHSPSASATAYRLYFEANNVNLRDTLIIDTSNSNLARMGFATEQKKFITISDLSNVSAGQYELTFEGVRKDGSKVSQSITLNITSNTTLSDVASVINSLDVVKAEIIDGSLVFIPTSDYEFDTSRISITDPNGFLTRAKATSQTYTVLKPSETLENIFSSNVTFDPTQGFQIVINNTRIHIDPTVDTLQTLVNKINAAGTGLIVDLTPRGALVFRAGRDFEFNLRNFTIKGPLGFFEAVGFVDENGNPNDFDEDWSEEYTLISKGEDFSTIRQRLSVAELLAVDRRETYEPYFFVNQWSVSSALLMNAEALAVDLGIALSNDTWNATSFKPTGRSNTEIMNLISTSRYDRFLANGKENFYEYFGGIVAELGVETETVLKMKENTDRLKLEIDQERERVKGVSLDEEMANMIKYQHAFGAAARVITAIDEMIGRVIDRLGVVGR